MLTPKYALSKYRSKPLRWWLQTPLYAFRLIRNRLGPSHTEIAVSHLVLEKAFFASGPGILIEIGAARPDFISIGALFRERGWRVLSVEPNPRFAQMHRDVGNEIYEFARGEHDEDDVEFSIVHSANCGEVTDESGSSLSIKPAMEARSKVTLDIERIRVKLRRLDSILAEYAPEIDAIDCLAIDVEGWELEVLRGFDLERFRPRVVIIENLLKDPKYPGYMKNFGYRLWKTRHPNEIYKF